MYSTIFANKDLTITNVEIDQVSKTGSNTGLSEILELYRLTSSAGGRGYSRILMKFDLTDHSQSIAAGNVPTSSVEYKLNLKNAAHAEEIPTSFDVVVYPMSKSFDEGVGMSMYDEDLKDANSFADWDNAKRSVAWDSAGGDFISSISASQHFDTGEEDLDVDISNIVYAFLTGNVENKGLMIKFIDTQETGSDDLYIKKFYARHAHRPDRVPKLEAFWEDFKQDDRGNIFYKTTGSLYYYRYINGSPKNVGETVFVDLLNSSASVIQTITASNPETGIYHASGAFVLPDNSTTDVYNDVWFTANEQLFTGTFTVTHATGSDFFDYDDLDIKMPNIKESYPRGQSIMLRVLGLEKDYKPAIRKSASFGKIDTKPLSEAYYQIEDAETEDVIVSFSTGSNKFSKLSYDTNGNYFKLETDSLFEGGIYKIKIKADYNNQEIVYDKGWKFKVLTKGR